ncbi:BA14K family protein [Rhizobium sp. AG207R]|nr:BA14K family protein [Rhizobium sp. AG207R]
MPSYGTGGADLVFVQAPPPGDDAPLWNGYHGVRTHRPGYRFHDGYWFPLAAFTVGAIAGAAIANDDDAPPPAPEEMSQRHYSWCANRYRSYDPDTDTYLTNGAGRRHCISPYD